MSIFSTRQRGSTGQLDKKLVAAIDASKEVRTIRTLCEKLRGQRDEIAAKQSALRDEYQAAKQQAADGLIPTSRVAIIEQRLTEFSAQMRDFDTRRREAVAACDLPAVVKRRSDLRQDLAEASAVGNAYAAEYRAALETIARERSRFTEKTSVAKVKQLEQAEADLKQNTRLQSCGEEQQAIRDELAALDAAVEGVPVEKPKVAFHVRPRGHDDFAFRVSHTEKLVFPAGCSTAVDSRHADRVRAYIGGRQQLELLDR